LKKVLIFEGALSIASILVLLRPLRHRRTLGCWVPDGGPWTLADGELHLLPSLSSSYASFEALPRERDSLTAQGILQDALFYRFPFLISDALICKVIIF